MVCVRPRGRAGKIFPTDTGVPGTGRGIRNGERSWNRLNEDGDWVGQTRAPGSHARLKHEINFVYVYFITITGCVWQMLGEFGLPTVAHFPRALILGVRAAALKVWSICLILYFVCVWFLVLFYFHLNFLSRFNLSFHLPTQKRISKRNHMDIWS